MMYSLLDEAKGTDMCLPILILLTAGLRRGELLTLRWGDIDFKKNLLKIRRNMVHGENGYVIKSPKTESGIRDIRLGDDVMKELELAKKQYSKDMLTYGAGFQNLGFVIRQEDGSPLKPDSMTRKWIRFLDSRGLPRIRLHDLRHSDATALIQAGVNHRVSFLQRIY